MRKAFLGAVSVLLISHPIASPLRAQSTASGAPRLISKCSSGLRGGGPECAQDRRLLIVVTVNGSVPSPVMLSVIGIASISGGAFALTPSNATSVDSVVYAVLNVTRDAELSYRIDRSIAGAKVGSTDNCRGYSTGFADDMGFGAQLTLETQKLVRCAQHARGAPSY